jgi:cytochrome c556
MIFRTFVLLLATGCILSLSASAQEPTTDAKTFMRAKLKYSQQILEALALSDFSNIERASNQLKLLSLDVNWQVRQTLEYRRQSAAFRDSANRLIEAGEKRNIDGAVLAYFQLTQNCVSCHKHLRDTPVEP